MDDGSAGARMQMSLIRADEPAVPVAIMAPTVHRPNEQFTALLHHINPETLRLAFMPSKRDAAPGVDGATCQTTR